jgi:hypothetical protein
MLLALLFKILIAAGNLDHRVKTFPSLLSHPINDLHILTISRSLSLSVSLSLIPQHALLDPFLAWPWVANTPQRDNYATQAC